MALDGDRDLVRLEARRAHVDRRADDLAAAALQLHDDLAGARIDAQVVAVGLRQPALDHVLGEAAHAVAAHLRLGAVGVEQAHARVRVGDRWAAR